MNCHERILAMLEGRPVDRLPRMPITMMLATDVVGVPYGRYATDYRVLVEGQLRTAETFDFDYVSCISDPAREAADCGATVQFFDDQPPAIDEIQALLTDKTMLARLQMPDPLGGGRMHDRVQAAALFREKVGGRRWIEGWIEGPCAEAADLRGINRLMTDFFDDPVFVRDLFEFTLELGLRFGRAQVEAGIDMVGVGDAAASLVGPQIYEEFVLPYEKRIVDGLHAMGTKVRLHICGNTNRILAGMGSLGCEIVDIDSKVTLATARAAMGTNQVLSGNIDPVKTLRNGTPASVAAAIAQCYLEAGPRYIIAAGCEVPRDTPAENVRAMLVA
ncbi:MAG: uroporphyrinogen decarboxylase family protein [Planctomycetota bacterium]